MGCDGLVHFSPLLHAGAWLIILRESPNLDVPFFINQWIAGIGAHEGQCRRGSEYLRAESLVSKQLGSAVCGVPNHWASTLEVAPGCEFLRGSLHARGD
eukprot:s1377_g2.t1